MKPRNRKSFAVRLVNVRVHAEDRLLLTKALTALRMAKPTNDRAAQQIKTARRDITEALRRHAA